MTYQCLPYEMNPRKSSIMVDRVELNKRQLDCTYSSTQKF